MEPTLFGRYPVKFAKIDTTSTATVVAAVANHIIRAVSFFAVAGGAVGIKWQSDTTDLTGVMGLAANGGISVDSEVGIFETAVGEPLVLNLSAAVQVGGSVSYILIKTSGLPAGDLG